MSSNNQLIILKNKKGEIEVHHNLCVDNDFTPSKKSLLKSFKDKDKNKNLKQAIKFAQEYCRTEFVEYGYHIEERALE